MEKKLTIITDFARFSATFTRIPDSEITVIILNNTNAHVSTLAHQIIKEITPLLELDHKQDNVSAN
jgi:hypothetical protein